MADYGPIEADELDAIEARCRAASTPPWEPFIEGRDHDSGDTFIRIGGLDDSEADMYVSFAIRIAGVTPSLCLPRPTPPSAPPVPRNTSTAHSLGMYWRPPSQCQVDRRGSTLRARAESESDVAWIWLSS